MSYGKEKSVLQSIWRFLNCIVKQESCIFENIENDELGIKQRPRSYTDEIYEDEDEFVGIEF
jgi:hypothetical protein